MTGLRGLNVYEHYGQFRPVYSWGGVFQNCTSKYVHYARTPWERMVTFYDFPEEHCKHLRTTNPVESPFASVRLRTNAGKR